MCTLYESILSLCKEKGIKGGRMCSELGLSKSLMTDLKAGRKKSITSDTAQLLANYFGVSVDRVLGVEEPAARAATDEEIKFALFGGAGDVTDAMLEEVKQFARMVKLREDAENKKGE